MSVTHQNFDGESLITPARIAESFEGSRTMASDDLQLATDKLMIVLNLAQQSFQSGRAPATIIEMLAERLHEIRRGVTNRVWQALILQVHDHPVCSYVFQDPFTKWSFDKPRGYSGDASLLDFIYEHEAAQGHIDATSDVGRAIYAYTKEASSSVAVRERRQILADTVDELASSRAEKPEVLAVASGYLREACLSEAFSSDRLARWVALDQDPISVGTVARDFEGTSVSAVDGSVRGILRGKHDLGTFDLVYAAGLYDYLPDNVAIKLTQRCVDMLKPGGTFLFANFSDEVAVDGYMESFMNWALLLRSEADMWSIVRGSVDRNEVEANVWFGENRNIVYATLTKR